MRRGGGAVCRGARGPRTRAEAAGAGAGADGARDQHRRARRFVGNQATRQAVRRLHPRRRALVRRESDRTVYAVT